MATSGPQVESQSVVQADDAYHPTPEGINADSTAVACSRRC